MSAIKTIRIKNIQSHKDVYIELPETGLVAFSGDNSNGKSVIRKVLEDTIAYNISKARVRKSLVNMEVSEGSLEIVKYDGSALFVNVNLEASRTFVTLTRKSGEQVTRYLADKTIPELVREFGFHYNDNRDISLNICDSDAALLFFKTNHVTNGDILNSALSDNRVEQKQELLQGIYHEALALRQTFSDSLIVAQTAKDAIVLYDIEEETAIMHEARKYANILSHIYIPDIWEAYPVPRITYINLPRLRISTYQVPPVVVLPPIAVKSADAIWEEIKTLEKGVCPTCRRPFSSHQTCTSET